MGFFDSFKKKNMDLGGSIVSKNILNGKGKILWCIREESINKDDNGWRFFSDIDDDVYLSNPANMAVCAWDTVVEIEPAVLLIFNMPVGTEIVLEEQDDGSKIFVDPETGDEIEF